jgi:transposase
MGTDEKDREQKKRDDLKSRIRRLRAEGKAYREIAKSELVSIAQISRILNEPKRKEEEVPSNQPGEIAAKVFSLLEDGRTLPEVVIQLRFEPKIVEDLYNKWIRLRGTDVNYHNLDRLDEKLQKHILNHRKIENLLLMSKGVGEYRRRECSNVDEDSVCMFSTYLDEETAVLRCAFCLDFESREEPTINIIVEPQFPPYYQF